MILNLIAMMFSLHVNAQALEIQSPDLIQKTLKTQILSLKQSQPSFCESYEDFEECDQEEAGPDGPYDDGEGPDPRDGGDPGPDETGDGL